MQFIILILLLLRPSNSIGSPIISGKAFFQTQNIDAVSGMPDSTYYPPLAAPNRVSVTTVAQNPKALVPPYRLHSWLGGAMLWATGKMETDSTDGYFVARNVPSTNVWPAELFQQAPLIADPLILQYLEAPNQANSDPTTRGINLCFPFPYYDLDAAYSPGCQAADATWQTTPLALKTDSQKNILLFPTNAAPIDGQAVGSLWAPDSILVDRMGDWDVDLIFQNPANPYIKTPFSDPSGQGEYIKLTCAQGSPFVFVECRGVEFIGISNRMVGDQSSGLLAPATTAAAVPGVSKVSYARLGGNQNNPAIFAEGSTLNPPGLQDNFTTWAVYFKNDIGITFVPGLVTTQPQNSYLQFPNTTQKFYFVIAGIPTIFAYPTQGQTYAQAIAQTGNDVDAYAQEMGKFAFNFLTDTVITYSVTCQTFLETCFTTSLVNPYSDSSMVAAESTVMCLMPHHYQDQTFAPGLRPIVLDLDGSTDFAPTGADNLFYWSVRGNLKAILGNSFKTNYIFSNFLPGMPTPFWTDMVNTQAGPFSIGQLLFDNIDNEYINNLANKAFAPWNTGYYANDKGIYDVGKSLAKAAKETSLVLQFLQGIQDNANAGDFFHTFFFNTLIEQQYNNVISLPDRPGAFNAPESKPRLQALQDGLKSSIVGTTMPMLAGVQGAIANYFLQNPLVTKGKAPFAFYNLSHYAYYDPIGNMVMLYPSAGEPQNPGTTPTPWPSRDQTLPIHSIFGEVGGQEVNLGKSIGIVWESFGVANAFNDHHYQLGYWISAAALAALYDGAWSTTADAGIAWGAETNYGQAIDQLVKDICFNKENNGVDLSFYNNPSMKFAKLNFFDQWAGHGWADGIQATIAGGSSGHNENSVGEALQGYASIILWGMATGRKDIVDLGIYLYTTASYAMDSYFFDKNLNLKKGQLPTIAFVPVTTKTMDPTYPVGTAFIDTTIHSSSGGQPTSSGAPKIAQAVINYSSDFGQTPENIKLITAFPCSAWSLVFGRNKDYLNAWNASMDTAAFVATIPPGITTSNDCWQITFDGNMNMLRMLGGNTIAFGQTDLNPMTAPTPYQFMLNVFTMFGPTPPWGSQGGAFVDPTQSINEVLHFMHVIDHYGTPDWTVFGHAIPDKDALVFTAAFTKDSTTTYFAYNPTLEEKTVQFADIATKTPLVSFTVKPKRWAMSPQPST
jgi:hypothetical protein